MTNTKDISRLDAGHHSAHRERGQAVVMVTISSLALFGVLGLAVDLGWGYYVHLNARSAADGAALAAAEAALQAVNAGAAFNCGSNGLACQPDETACRSTPVYPPANNLGNACLYAQANGFNASGNQSVTVQSKINSSIPTATGIANAQYWVTVRVSQKTPQLFSAIFGHNTLSSAARATAAIVPAYTGGCIYVLDPTDQNAFVASGSASVNAPCGIYVNSNNSKAVQVTGGACVNAGSGSFDVVGGDSGSNGCMTPAPTTGYSSVSDPLASLQEPAFPSSCDYTNSSYSGVTQTLNPGVYCGGITISGSSSITFNPGLYTLVGGGLNSSSSHASLSGAGVSFYNTACGNQTSNTCPGSGYNGSYQPLVISGGGSATLSAPTSGLYNNILFMQDRTLPIQNAQETLSGGSTGNFTGTIYVPRSPLVYSGGSSTSSPNVAFVAWTVTFSGPSYLSGAISNSGSGTGARVALVE